MTRTADLILKAASRLPPNDRHLAELVVESAVEIAGSPLGKREATDVA